MFSTCGLSDDEPSRTCPGGTVLEGFRTIGGRPSLGATGRSGVPRGVPTMRPRSPFWFTEDASEYSVASSDPARQATKCSVSRRGGSPQFVFLLTLSVLETRPFPALRTSGMGAAVSRSLLTRDLVRIEVPGPRQASTNTK